MEETDLPLLTEPVDYSENDVSYVDRRQIFKTNTLQSYCGRYLLRSALVGETRFRDELSYSEDFFFLAELAEHASSIRGAVNPLPLYYYYQRENSGARRIGIADRFDIARLLAEKAIRSPKHESVYLDQAVKRCLSTRYLAAHILPDRSVTGECGRYLGTLQKRISRTDTYHEEEKLIILAMISVTGLYWLFRSVTEPYIWKWEKAERKKRREAKNAPPADPG